MFKFKWVVNVGFLSFMMLFSSVGYADDSDDQPLVKALRNFFFGVQIGYANAEYTASLLSAGAMPTSIKKDHIAARVYLGYDFNQYLAGELTALYFLTRPEFSGIPTRKSPQKIKNNILAMMGKFTWPVHDKIKLYARGGIGYIVREGLTTVGGGLVPQITFLPKGEFFTPIYGLGASYNIHSDWFIDFSWLQTPRASDKQLPQENFIGIGVYYAFPKS